MKQATDIREHISYWKGSTGHHAAVPRQSSISARPIHLGPAPSRLRRGEEVAEQPPAKRWKVVLGQAKTQVSKRRARLRRQCLTVAYRHTAKAARIALGYTRLITFLIRLSRTMLFRKAALPNGVLKRFVHDRRFALFTRRCGAYLYQRCSATGRSASGSPNANPNGKQYMNERMRIT